MILESPCKDCKQECPSKGCKLWRDWWIAHWNQNICRKQPQIREKWQYEHPDLFEEDYDG